MTKSLFSSLSVALVAVAGVFVFAACERDAATPDAEAVAAAARTRASVDTTAGDTTTGDTTGQGGPGGPVRPRPDSAWSDTTGHQPGGPFYPRPDTIRPDTIRPDTIRPHPPGGPVRPPVPRDTTKHHPPKDTSGQGH